MSTSLVIYSFLVLALVLGTKSQLQCPGDIAVGPLPFGQTETTRDVTWDEPGAPAGYILTFQSHKPGNFPVGISVVTYRFENTGSSPTSVQQCSFRITVQTVDTEPPVIANCPASPLTFQNEISDRHVLANWTEPTATDNSGQVVLVDKSDKSPGQFIYVGGGSVISVTYVFEDGSHNQAFCSFDIHIQSVDTTPPRIDYCPSIIEKVIPLHENGTFVSETPTVTDNSGQFSVLIEPEIRNNYFTAGLTKVNYIYTDPSGNTASCEVNIHVIKKDLSPPEVVYCPPSVVFGVKPGVNETFVQWDHPTVVDDSGFFTTDYYPGEGIYVVGSTFEVNFEFCDLANNCAYCSFAVSVVEDNDIPNVFRCPSEDVVRDVTPTEMNATVSWEEPFAEDNSFISRIIQTHYPSDSFRVGNTPVEYAFIDHAGNSASCKFNVIVRDNSQTDSSTGDGNNGVVVAVIVCLTIIIIVVLLIVAFFFYLRNGRQDHISQPIPAPAGGVKDDYEDLVSTRRPLPSIRAPVSKATAGENLSGTTEEGYMTPMPN